MAIYEGERKLAAILSADVVGYSKLMADDEAATVRTLKEYRASIERVIDRHGGRVVNAPGDNILTEFPSAVEAVEAAAADAVFMMVAGPEFAAKIKLRGIRKFEAFERIAKAREGIAGIARTHAAGLEITEIIGEKQALVGA